MLGLHFKKLDLHVHTPASKCYLDKKQTAAQILQAALAIGLHGIAITDHNTAAWIDEMKNAAEGTGLVIFPGVEISLELGHLVAIFDPSATQKDVEGLLGNLELKPDEFGKSETVCTKNVYEVVDKIHARGGLAILAHIDQPKGIFNDNLKIKEDGSINVPAPLLKIINEAQFDAVECANGRLPDGFDEAHHIKRKPAFYQASDNPDQKESTKHSSAGIGSRHSWFKLDQLDIEGLRQCFADPEVRIQLMGMHGEIGYPKIIEMNVGGTGFLRGQKFDFHEGLNCLIGGQGVGKSLAIEMLRFGLIQATTSDNYLLEDHIKKLEKRLEVGNCVEITYQISDGTQYRINRVFEGRIGGIHGLQIQSTNRCENLTTGDEFKGDIARLCPILAYSQTEVIKIAEDKNAQLRLIDHFIDARQIVSEILKVRTILKENDGILNQSIQARGRLDVCQLAIRTLREQIAAINRALANPLFDLFKTAEKKMRLFDSTITYVDEIISFVRQWQVELGNQLIEDIPDDFCDDPTIKSVHNDAGKAKTLLSQSLTSVIPQLMAQKNKITTELDSWMPEYTQISQAYAVLLKEIGSDREAKEYERKRLEGQLSLLEKEEHDYLKLSDNLPNLLSARNTALDQLERVYHRYFDIRKEKYDELTKLSDNKLKLILNHAADRTDYLTNLSELVKGGQNAPTMPDREKIVNGIMPRRFVQYVLDHNDTHLADESGLTEAWAKKVIEKLWSFDDFTKVLALQHNCFPTDVPSIQFCKEGGVYDDLTELSGGQKCTALLIIALCDGTMPVVIDQPEDALDVISVWEDISKKLRRGKNSRQFILTTHNSSVAVASDTDQFIVMKAGATAGRIVASGAIDRPEVKKAVIDHLEGGEDPYILRSKKYNIHAEQK
jgi:hypothetical protein